MSEELLRLLGPNFIVGLAGPSLTDEERALLARYPIPGVILFDRNVAGVRALMDLTQELRRLFRRERGRVPLIAADHEGGVVSVLSRAIGVPPTQMATARTKDAKLCERLFADNARRLRSCGVNMFLGPVADVNSEPNNPVIGTRSFGDDVDLVSNFTAIAVRAARREGVLTCLKHFPGHGSTATDSHLALPVLSASLDELRALDVRPFARGAAAGAECVMMGHVAPRGRSLPASLDAEIIGGLLRREIGFEGVVMTDALEMRGVRVSEALRGDKESPNAAPNGGGRSLNDICRLSVEAGNDLLLFSRPLAEVAAAFGALGGKETAAFRGESFAAAAGAAAGRVQRLLAVAERKDREFELPSDAGIGGEIARKAVRVIPDGGITGGMPKEPAIVFYADRGDFDQPPVKRFIERSLRSLGVEGGPAGAEAGRATERALEPREIAAPGASGLESRIFRREGGGESPADIAFFLNRRPVAGDAVKGLSARCRLAVIAGWPYADGLLAPGCEAVVTYGLYDAAADLLGSLIGRAG